MGRIKLPKTESSVLDSTLEVNFDGETGEVSDGYHTFNELYDHRIELFLTICRISYDLRRIMPNKDAFPPVWRSKYHSDGTSFVGWFIAGMWKEKGKQITYHVPMSKWDNTAFMETLEKAPEWDGHTSADVLERLKQL